MKIVTVTRYQALDGELFESEADCIEYETAKKYNFLMQNLIAESDMDSNTEERILNFLSENKTQIIEFCKTL